MSNSLYISRQPTQDGTSQQRRMPQALQPDYIAIDERSRDDLLVFARALATEIRYYNADNDEDGNWEAFFTDEIPESAPHKALFITFLELFKYAQEHLNTLTQRHLDFYYKEVLQLEEKPATPDQVHVLFQLAKNVKNHLIKAGTLLKAGKDSNGNPLYYATGKDIVVNKATIGSLKTLYVEKNEADITQNIHAAPVADSSDGLGTPFEEENTPWEIFGSTSKGEEAIIGLGVASPLLFLNEGYRRIEILFTFSADVTTDVNNLVLSDTFEIQLSSEEGWITGAFENYATPPSGTPAPPALNSNQIGIAISFSAAQPAIMAHDKELHGDRFNTQWPVMKILLKDRESYDLLYNMELNNIGLTVHALGVRNLILQNDQGILNPAKPFLPFGPQPVIGSSFYIGSGEVFQKRLEDITLNIEWLDAPGNFSTHYDHYYEAPDTLGVADFQADISLLYQKSWLPTLIASNFQLFVDPGLIEGIDTLLGVGYEHNSSPQEITKYDQHTQTGFIRMELTGPTSPFHAFGHAEYPNLYTQYAIELANGTGSELPNAPYTPTIKSLSLDYTSTQAINFVADANNTEQFFHITPFGHSERVTTPSVPGDIPFLLPQYTDEGILYIGIHDLEPPQQLSILFRPAEGSADPDIDIRQEDILWSYLAAGQWKPLADQQILSDTTKAFQATGIIRFNIPSDASKQDSLMPEGLHWLKATLETGAIGAGKFIALDTQAVSTVFTDRGNDPARLNQAMEANTISGLAQKQAAVKSITQPYPSFNGIAAEQGNAFYTRISERLRHKARAVSGWDYERLILEKFPTIYKIKCLNHTEIDINNAANSSGDRPGHVTIITLPAAGGKNAANPLEPKTSNHTLIAIGEYIQKYTSSFITTDIRNPRYEQVQLRFKVRFKDNVDQGYYQQLLEEEVTRFLSPWAYENEEEIVFGNEIYKSAVLNFVEERPYVDFVVDFVVYHTFEDTLPDPESHALDEEPEVYHILHYYPSLPLNPEQETVMLDCIIGFDEAIVQENYADIPDFLSGVNGFFETIDGFFAAPPGGKPLSEVQRAEFMRFIQEDIEEVDFIRELRFYHIIGDTTLKEDTEKALAARPGSILTSAQTHEISLVGIDHECLGIVKIGIDYMIIQGDFVIS